MPPELRDGPVPAGLLSTCVAAIASQSTRGPYAGQIAEVDHIVPRAQARETDNELANLEMLPAKLNRAKSDKVGERQLTLAKKFRAAGLISEATMAKVQAKFVPRGTGLRTGQKLEG